METADAAAVGRCARDELHVRCVLRGVKQMTARGNATRWRFHAVLI